MAKVLFIQDVFYEHPGVGMHSAVLKSAGHHSDLLILSEDRRRLRDTIGSFRPDLGAF
jgi:hypothetical protein